MYTIVFTFCHDELESSIEISNNLFHNIGFILELEAEIYRDMDFTRIYIYKIPDMATAADTIQGILVHNPDLKADVGIIYN